MSLKIEGKSWNCNNQCKSDCCSEIFLPITVDQRTSFEKTRSFEVDNNYADFTWLSYHKAYTIEKLDSGKRKLTLKEGLSWKIIFNPFRNCDEIYVGDKCSKLLPDGKCKIYRARPQICQKAQCPVFSTIAKIQFYGLNGKLKRQVEEYKAGELKKW